MKVPELHPESLKQMAGIAIALGLGIGTAFGGAAGVSVGLVIPNLRLSGLFGLISLGSAAILMHKTRFTHDVARSMMVMMHAGFCFGFAVGVAPGPIFRHQLMLGYRQFIDVELPVFKQYVKSLPW